MSTSTEVIAVNPVVDAIIEQNQGRKADLVRLKYELMGGDLFAFFRGSDHLFAAAWPGLKPVDPGPAILICGDLHLENFGAFRADDGSFDFDVNDFDEATVAPCSVDLVRCSTSVLLAAEVWGLSPIQAMRTVLGFLENYRATIAQASSGEPAGRCAMLDELGPVEDLLGWTALGTQFEMLERFTKVDKSGDRTIKRSSGKFPSVGKSKADAVTKAVEAYGKGRGKADVFKVLDVSARIAGIGSLGVKRYVALVAGDGSESGNRLLDIKEAGPSSIAGLAEGPLPSGWKDDAHRVVDAQRRLQAKPTAGLDLIEVEDRAFRLREMIPDENRSRLDRFRRKPSKLRRAVEVAGRIAAWSQLRGAKLDSGDRTADLERWAAGPALDAVLASAVRFAGRTRDDYKAFRKARLDQD